MAVSWLGSRCVCVGGGGGARDTDGSQLAWIQVCAWGGQEIRIHRCLLFMARQQLIRPCILNPLQLGSKTRGGFLLALLPKPLETGPEL